jgi:hypothetical protein
MAAERLIRKAQAYLKAGYPIPLDLFAALMSEGIDVTELERTTN